MKEETIILERLNKALKTGFLKIGISKKGDMAVYLEYKIPYFSGIINGKEKLNDSFLKLISDKLHINSDWILTGEGEMFLDFTKGITGGRDRVTDKEFNEINNELGILGTLLLANKRAKEISDKFDVVRGKLIVIETYTKHYELLNRMAPVLTCYSQKQVNMNDVKEEFRANIQVLSEINSILEPYSETINELFEKLSEFDNQHDKTFLIEE